MGGFSSGGNTEEFDWSEAAQNAAIAAASNSGIPGAGVIAGLIDSFGPGYDPRNGGEVLRQLTSISEWMSDPGLLKAYCWHIQTYHTDLWNGGDIWATNGSSDWAMRLRAGEPSAYRGRYLDLRKAGYVDGYFNMDPQGQVLLVQNNGNAGALDPGAGDSGGGTHLPPKGGGQQAKSEVPTWVWVVAAFVVVLIAIASAPKRVRNVVRKAKARRAARKQRRNTARSGKRL